MRWASLQALAEAKKSSEVIAGLEKTGILLYESDPEQFDRDAREQRFNIVRISKGSASNRSDDVREGCVASWSKALRRTSERSSNS